ncbi:MAG: chlorophyllase/cutinase-like alpha/beta fold protein, partial [Candidatus Binatia bacterium]
YWSAARYGEDWYRVPQRFSGRRFRYTYLPADAEGVGIPGVPAAEIYRPCAPGTCGDLPAELERFEPPYPVVVIFHGFIATMTHHRFNAQVYAEAGYMAIVVNGIHPVPGAPNVQDAANGGEVLDWLASPASGVFGEEANLDRVAFAGHSQGSAAALSYQGDPRVHAIVAWDGGDGIADTNCTGSNPCAPIMYQRTDGAFSAPQATPRSDYPENRDRGLPTYEAHKERGMDVFHVTFRATSHIDWNGNGVGILAGNRLAEPLINYYALAWLDRHLEGKLVFDGDGNVVTTGGRGEVEERAFRQSQAEGAYQRLIAQRFPAGSIDKHIVSMGFFDPVQQATSGDVLYGGNVPYTIEGLWTTDRFATDFRSYCHVTVPDYVGSDSGIPGDGIPPAAVADSGGASGPGPADDMRIHGCPEATE